MMSNYVLIQAWNIKSPPVTTPQNAPWVPYKIYATKVYNVKFIVELMSTSFISPSMVHFVLFQLYNIVQASFIYNRITFKESEQCSKNYNIYNIYTGSKSKLKNYTEPNPILKINASCSPTDIAKYVSNCTYYHGCF